MDGLERDLVVWFADTAAPRTPDYVDEILALVAVARQRPRWSFPGRWLPLPNVSVGWVFRWRPPWRLALLVILAVALVGGVLLAGGRSHLPPPFGLAANGLVAYDDGDDIYTIDPESGARLAIVTGPTADQDPRFSLDGTKLAFLRASAAGTVLVIIEAGPGNQHIATTEAFAEVDPDGIQWSPDGRSIALSVSRDGSPAIVLVDVASGHARWLEVDTLGREVYWRPPDGRQLLFLGPSQGGVDLFLASVEGGDVQQLGAPRGAAADLRALGWTANGDRFLYQQEAGTAPRTTVLDIATGTVSYLDVAYGQLSNDGTRVFGMDGVEACVIPIDGGPCRTVGGASLVYEGSWHEGVFWSPDDRWIVVHPPAQQRPPLLVDPEAGRVAPASWIQAGAESWQRLAP